MRGVASREASAPHPGPRGRRRLAGWLHLRLALTALFLALVALPILVNRDNPKIAILPHKNIITYTFLYLSRVIENCCK